MQRLDRHDRVFITRRKRARALNNRPRSWFWVGQSMLGIVCIIVASVALVIGSGLLMLSAFWHQARAAIVAPLPEKLRDRLPLPERASPVGQPAA